MNFESERNLLNKINIDNKMKYILLKIFILLSIFILLFRWIFCPISLIKLKFYSFLSENPKPIDNEEFPKIVHLIYFPWERKTGKLKNDENDFNHDFYKKIKNQNPDYEIKLWTLSKIKNFVKNNYPEYSEIWKKIKHPTQAVDFFRLLITYHYGGIYWQYDSEQKTDLTCYVPPKDKRIRIFVETIINLPYSIRMGKEKIRNGKPEEIIRIANQCYSSFPKNNFLKYCLEKSWKNLNTLEVKNQYDILYTGANAMISEAFDEYKNKNEIFVTYNTEKYISFSSNGSWRLDVY